MKRLWFLLPVVLFGFHARGDTLRAVPQEFQAQLENLKATSPDLPQRCVDEAFNFDYAACISYRVQCDGSCIKGSVRQTLFVLVEKDLYPTEDEAIEPFINFDTWQQGCAADCDPSVVRINQSNIIRSESVNDQYVYGEQYLNLEAYVEEGIINLDWQKMVTFHRYWRIDPLPGQSQSNFFVVDLSGDTTTMQAENQDSMVPTPAPFEGQEGLKYQRGISSIRDYDEWYWLLTYDHEIRIQQDLVPATGAKVLNRVFFNLFQGMYDWDFAIYDLGSAVIIREQ